MDLQGKVVLVTGAAHGIGRATAHAFADRGAVLALADIEEGPLEKVRAEIEEKGGGASSMRVDVSSEDEVTKMIDDTITEAGALDVFVLNAGVSVSGPPEAMPLEDWRWVVDVNLWAHIYGIRAALPYFKERGSGHLVHVASAGGILGTPGLAAYCTTKFAVFGLAESLAVSLHDSGVGVSVVCPLWVATEIAGRGRITVDPNLGLDQESVRELGVQFLKSSGLPPEKVGSAIVEAVEEGRFLVLPHPEVLQYAQIKWSDPERYIERAAQAQSIQQRYFGESSAE